jgi:general nucleoside transport system permease protein
MIRVERRLEAAWWWTASTLLAALMAGFLVSALIVATTGADVVQAFSTLFVGAFGSSSALMTTLVKSTPLILTGLATVIAFRAQVWSIGQEGQVLGGAMAGYLGSQMLGGLPPVLFFPAVILFGVAGGVLLGGICAILKTRFGVNEIVSTVMTNYLVIYLLSYLLAGGPWTEISDGGASYQQSPPLPPNEYLPLLFGTKLHLGVLLPFVIAICSAVMLDRTALGYEVKALGINPTALGHKGTNIARTIIIVMCVSGGLAALAGVIELYGVGHRLRADNLVGLGSTGIIVAMIGGLRPMGTVLAGLLFGGLATGAVSMRVMSDIPASLVPAMQGIILLFVLCASVMARYKIVRGTVQ